jgi:transposase-like protein
MDRLLPDGVGNADTMEHLMSRRPRRNPSPAFKAKVPLAALRGDQTLAEFAQQFDVRPNPISDWRSQFWPSRSESLATRGRPFKG